MLNRIPILLLIFLLLAACGPRNFDEAGSHPPEWYYSRKGATAVQFRQDSRDCTVSRKAETSRNLIALFFLILIPGEDDQKGPPSAEADWFTCMDGRGWQRVPKSGVDLLCAGIQSEGDYSRYAPPECVSVELGTRVPGGELNVLPKEPEEPAEVEALPVTEPELVAPTP